LLVREMRRHDGGDPRAAIDAGERTEAAGGVIERVRPRGGTSQPVATHAGLTQAAVVHEAVSEAALIAHPGLVHRVVATGQKAMDLPPRGADLDVAAVGAVRTHALGLVEEPH